MCPFPLVSSCPPLLSLSIIFLFTSFCTFRLFPPHIHTHFILFLPLLPSCHFSHSKASPFYLPTFFPSSHSYFFPPWLVSASFLPFSPSVIQTVLFFLSFIFLFFTFCLTASSLGSHSSLVDVFVASSLLYITHKGPRL